MLRNLLLASCIAAIPSVALAQTATPPNATRAQMSGKFLAMPAAGQIRAADLRSADIYTADNQKVGDIDDILLDNRGNVVAVIVGVGGFLGMGEKNVAIPFEALDMTVQGNRGSTTSTSTRGSGMPANTAANRDAMTTGAVPNTTTTATDQDRQRATAERSEQMAREQAAAQRSTTTTTTTTSTSANQRMVQADGLWKPERILLKGVTKAELENAPAFKWDANAPARNR